ncbi:apicoplast pyruvate carrier 1-like [Convolutriloba macropyga]|uniref:apicoplast pyruvate carrier 1-like n=1 Tax=Convolutriloba macropyga TaxID=536237 RepID=UPI003F528CE4
MRQLGTFGSKMWKNKQGILAMFGVTLLLAVFGTCYSSGNMSPYVTSYLKFKTDSTWVTYTTSVWIFTCCNSSIGLFAILGGIFTQFIQPRFVILGGLVFQSLSILLTGWLIEYGYVPLIFIYGLMQGFGIGIAYPLCVKFAQMWYPENSGLITGIVVAGFGSGSFVINFVQTAIINPENLSPNYQSEDNDYFTQNRVLNNVPKCFFILGSLYASLSLIGLALMTERKPHGHNHTQENSTNCCVSNYDPPQQSLSSEHQDAGSMSGRIQWITNGNNEKLQSKPETKMSSDELLGYSGKEFTIQEALKNVSFWVALLVLSYNEYLLIIISTYYKTFGQTFIRDDAFLSLVGSVSSVTNALGRIAWGLIMDFSSYKTSMLLLCTCQGLLAITMPVSQIISNVTIAKTFYLLWVGMMFANTGGTYVLTPSAVGKAFGLTNFGVNYGFVFCFSGFTGFALTEVVSLVLDNTTGWTYVFLVGAAISFACQLLTLFWSMKNRRNENI